MLGYLHLGLSLVLEPLNLFLIAAGCFGGIIIGAIPGLTATMAVALLIPITFGMDMIPAICMLVGVYTGGISGGFISSALLKIPGTPSSIATTFDTYPLVMRGEHSKALGLALLASFFGGTASGVILTLIAPSLAKVAMKFGPFEYFALVVFTFGCISSFSSGTIWKPFFAAAIGVTVSMVGSSPVTAVERFTFGLPELGGGFSLMPALIGLFAVPQIMKDVRRPDPVSVGGEALPRTNPGALLKNLIYFKTSIFNLVRTIFIGTGIGILPGVGPGLANIVSYAQAKSGSKHPERFGTGEPEAIIAAEAGNNSAMGGAMVPMLTLGIPGDPVTLMMMGAFMLHGIQPGPLMFKNNSDVVYSIFIAFLAACVFTVLFQVFFMNLFVKVLSVRKHYLGPVLLVMCVVGSFTFNNRMFDVWCFLGFGLLGYILELVKIPLLPIILGLILGPMAENHLRTALDLSSGSLLPFITRPIPAVFLIATVFFLLYPYIKKRRAAQA